MAAQSNIALDDLRRVLESAPIDGALEVRSGEQSPDGVFVETPTVLAIEATATWDRVAVRNALTTAAASLWTASASGTAWTAHQRGARTWYSLDGLAPPRDRRRWQSAAVGQFGTGTECRHGSAQSTSHAVRRRDCGAFRHLAGRDDYRKIVTLLDRTQPAGKPAFFSTDLWSLSGIFTNVREVEIRTSDTGSTLRETVTYRMR